MNNENLNNTTPATNGPNYTSPAEPSPADRPGPVFRDKSPKSPALVGTLCGIAGLAIGAAAIFGIMQMLPKPTSECAERDCSKCQTSTTGNLTTDFFGLEPQGQNILYSPLSIRYGLSLLDAGAAGTTKTQIENVLGNEELPKYENVADTLSLANSVFIRDTFENKVLSSYVETVQNNYNSEIFYDDFSSAANMDNWVSQKTFGLIDQIGVQPTDDTNMVLANALAIQMDWESEFDDSDTMGRSFYKQNEEEIKATTMTQLTNSDDIKYYVDDNITLLSLPLQKTETSVGLDFVAVMPSGGLESYISNLDMDSIETAITNATPASKPEDGVEIYIPKFKFEYDLALKQDLQELGITQAFDGENANFSAMAEDPLYVSDAIHKANIDFSEKGIKAAAVTVFMMADTAMDIDASEPKPVVINIDHPFLFLIRDRDNGAIWFIGAVYEPNLWADDQADYR